MNIFKSKIHVVSLSAAKTLNKFPSVKSTARKALTTIHFHQSSSAPPIVLLSARRTGSTWLMESLGAAKALGTINEPFDQRFLLQSPLVKVHGFSNHIGAYNLLPGTSDFTSDIESYLKDYSSMRICGAANPLLPNYKFFSNRLIYKIIHTNLCFPMWLDICSEYKKIFLLRHPAATILSQLKVYKKDVLDSIVGNESFIQYLNLTPDQIDTLKSATTSNDRFYRFSVLWCLEHLGIWRHSTQNVGPAKISTVFYENLIKNREESLISLCRELSISDVNSVLKASRLPSMSTNKSSYNKLFSSNNNSLLEGWMSHLNDNDKATLTRVLRTYEIGFYSAEKAMPAVSRN